ncbi:dockerin type I domain-containing protein [Herbivorax sp. ANBcel31]|uniref:dockerin type I domain-containing protein n=1 Tax=Herbivorax sp. ANBcel31 TaxID=3069754 RepID=UPI0027B64924|nr:dockerin type I domain-containing protein [Herbivorax sp. ANBcel31]MDQ2085784.1 dockerin type I domain-containing protein [Herbivorax sp. ANBcel31]
MPKRIISLLVISSILLVICIPGFGLGASAYPRNGFRLVASNSDSTGISVDTEFLLETEEDFSLEQVKEAFSIDGEPDPIIEELDKNFFSINLSRPLMENSIYTFRMSTDVETTWVFQTQTEFCITGSLPGNESIGVPVNSGIEINFSHDNFSNIKNHFEITPDVSGKFETYDKTAVFVPDELEYETLYTVKIKEGIKINGTDRVIDEDYIFSFETRSEQEPSQPEEPTLSVNYIGQITDFSSEDEIEISLQYSFRNLPDGSAPLNLNTSIYAYNDFESFHEAILIRNKFPEWAQINYSNNFVPVDELDKVFEFDQVLNEDESLSGTATIKIPPKLPTGYYILDSYCEGTRTQKFIQVTDTSIYITKTSSDTLVWLNDMQSSQPLTDAEINFTYSDDTFITDNKGIATFDSELIDDIKRGEPNNDNYFYPRYYYGSNYTYNKQFMTVTTSDGKKSLLDTSSFSDGSSNDYWRYFFTDRGMYKPDDTINVWGFIKNRYEDENIDYLTLEISQGYYHWTGNNNLPILNESISVNNNFYEEEIELPNLPRGYYTIRLKKGNSVITTSNIEVQDYVKPSYKMEIDKDKVAAFIGDEVNFNLSAEFFEGTGVSNLDTSYTISTRSLTGANINENDVTDTSGKLNIKYVPEVTRDIQGIYTIPITARALLPETGEINASNSVMVFVNDIDVKRSGEIKDEKGYINATVHEIVLDRLNDGTAEHSRDYLGDTVENKQITGTIYKNTWVREKTGTHYDRINKVTYDTYRYNLETSPIEDFSMTTDQDGQAQYIFDAPEIKDSYYTAEINCVDNSGRDMSYSIYIGKRIDYSGYNNHDRYSLDSDKDNYRIGEDVELQYTFGNENLPEGDYVYILSQNGMVDYETSNSSTHTFEFIKEYMPNVHVTAVYFTGRSYVAKSKRINYEIEEKNLIIEGETDKDSYKPGETVNLNVNVTDTDGNPVKSTVNASIVDEAFFSLKDQNINVLNDLFANVGSGIYFDKKSHTTAEDFWGRGGIMPPGFDDALESELDSGGESDIRSDFRDTANFVSIETDDSGKGNVSFKLPDNVTSWRITLSAISKDLYGGSETTNMIVTLPFFINYSFNSSYMAGDTPVMAVNAYGTGLTEDEDVYFEVYDKDDPDTKVTVSGNAFERVNIPLWTFEEGYYDLIIRAYTESGFSDAVLHSINVVDSYYQIEKSEFFEASPGMDITIGEEGYTNLVFQDKSKGMYFWNLLSLYNSYGNRIDQITSRYLASELLDEHFSDSTHIQPLEQPDISDYQKPDGGLSLLPYSESDIDLTAKMVTFAKDIADTSRLRTYFNRKLDDNDSRIKALYGLSALGEPVLLELNEAKNIDNLSIMDAIYLALSYYELGDYSKAEKIYDERISQYIEKYTPYYRVNTNSTKDSMLEATSLCAYLSALLDKPEKEGLYKYCTTNFTRDILIFTEKLLFISENINNLCDEDTEFTYSYEDEEHKVDLNNGRSFSLRLLPHQFENFEVTDVKGDVSLVSIFKENVFDIKDTSDDISISRSYHFENGTPLDSNTLQQGDIIRVRLEWDISDTAFDGSYEITDYLPSGLKPYRSMWNTEGQKVTYYIHNSSYWRNLPYIEYLARVVSPGEYTAQGPVIQGRSSRDIINSGKTETITVKTDELVSDPIDPPPFVPEPEPISYGDLNGDGIIDSTDYTILTRYLLEVIDDFPAPKEAADLNGDGSIDSTDLFILRRYLLAYIDSFPVEDN